MKTFLFRLFGFLALFALALTACKSAPKLEDQIIGSWEFTDPELNVVITFEFQKDSKLVISAEGAALDATYTWEDADTIKLVITVDGETSESLGDVKIVDDALTLTIDGEAQTMKRSRR